MIAVQDARVCADCDVVFQDRGPCPRCASELGVWPLAKWINRPRVDGRDAAAWLRTAIQTAMAKP